MKPKAAQTRKKNRPKRRVHSSSRVRIAANYVRLLTSFTLGLLLVRLLLGIGEEAFGLIALLGAGTGIASAIKEVVRASMVPELGAAYHSNDGRFRETYNTALLIGPLAAAVTLAGFTVLAVAIRWIQVPDELVTTARIFVVAKALQTFFTVSLAPTFNMYMVTERMVAHNVWVIIERLSDVFAATIVVVFLKHAGISTQIVSYGVISASLAILSQVSSCGMLLKEDKQFRPALRAASTVSARSLMHSVGWNGVVVLAMNLYLRVDMFIMNIAFGLFGNFVFGLASQLTNYVRLLTMGIVTGVDAVAARLASSDHKDRMRRLIHQSTRLQAAIVFPATCLLVLLTEPVIQLWVGARITEPDKTIPVLATMVRILIIGVSARGLSEGWMRVLAGAGEVRLYAPTMLMVAIANPLVACGCVFWWGGKFELFAPAIVFSCLLLVVHLLYIPTVVARHYGMNVSDVLTPLVRPAVATLLGFVCLTFVRTIADIGFLSVTLIFSSVYVVACGAFVLRPLERTAIFDVALFRNRSTKPLAGGEDFLKLREAASELDQTDENGWRKTG